MVRKTFTFEGKIHDVKAKNEIELALKIDKKKRQLEEGSLLVNKTMTVRKWSEKWLPTYKSKSTQAVTYNGYHSRLNSIILPAIGNMKVKDVRPIHIQGIVNDMGGMSKEYINKVAYTMKQMFEAAKRNKLIFENPVVGIEMPKSEDGTHRAVTEKEREVLLKVADTLKYPHGLWIKIMIYTGLRPGETASLQGRNINLLKMIITVDSALKSISNEIGPPKSKSSFRNVPVPNVFREELSALNLSPFDFVLENKAGRHLTNSNLRSMWRAIKRQMNIEMGCRVCRNKVLPSNQKMVERGASPIFPVAGDLVPYCLRHTYCTDLQAAGVPINVAKELMGHSDINITAKIYTHSSEISFSAAAESINKFLSAPATNSESEKLSMESSMENNLVYIEK